MATEIKQTDDATSRTTTLRVDGEMFHDDAVLLEKIAECISTETGNRVVIDLADLDLLDSEAAPMLRRLERRKGFEIKGLELFLQAAVNMAERSASD